MFLRVKTFKNRDGSKRDYLFLVATKRIKGKTKQVTLANFGRIDKENDFIPEVAEKLAAFSNKLKVLNLAKDIKSTWSKEYGPVLIFRKLWESLGLEEFLKDYLKRTKISFKAVDIIFSQVLNRLLEPKSELATHQWVDTVYGLPKAISVHQWYRALDFLIEHKEELEQDLFTKDRDLFNQTVDVVLMDTTSLVYWGDSQKADKILDYGYSKQKRFDLKQVVVGIFMTKEGIPIGHEVYPGNTNDIKAFKEMIAVIKNRHSIRRVVIVCDRGMVSKENLSNLEKDGYEYVVGMRMRQIKKGNAGSVLNTEDMQEVSEKLKAKETQYQGRRLIVCHNIDQDKRDKVKRTEILARLTEKLKTQGLKSLLVSKEYKKYLKIEAKKPEIDEDKVKREELFDGKFVLETNTELNWKEVVVAYKDLWQVEHAFKTLKNELAMGPVYHYTEKRIRAHIFVCFLALLLKVSLEKALKKVDKASGYTQVLGDIKKLKALKLDFKGSGYILRTELEGKAYLAFKALGLRIPPRIISGNINEDETVVLRL